MKKEELDFILQEGEGQFTEFKENLGTMSIRRNPLIAELFHRIHFVEKMGTGIKRIREECKKRGNVRFRAETNGYFIAEFKLKQVSPQKTPPKPTESEQRVIDAIKKNNSITREEIAKELKISAETVKEYLDKLKKKGLLSRVGGRKQGHWEVL